MEIKPGTELSDNEKFRDYTIVTGKPKFGKSYLTKNVLVKKYNRVLILDRMDEYQGVVINDLEELFEYIQKHKIFRIRITDLTHEKIDDILKIAWYFGKMAIVFEEANIWFSSKSVLSPIQADIILRSRHRAMSLIFVTQRYRRLHIDLRAAYQEMYIFRQTNKKDVDELEDDTGENLQEVFNYPVGEYFFTEN